MRNIFGIRAFALLFISLVGTSAFAQTTSSGVDGTVRDTAGNAVSGANIEVVHVPSGTTKVILSQENGRFSAKGLRVGGPYTITASKAGFVTETSEGMRLELGKDLNLDIVLKDEAASLDKVQVVGAATSGVFDPGNMGTGTNVSRQEIEAYPTISRSLNDYARLDPRIVVVDKGRGEISVAGQNNRYNNISVDGVPTNDEFGLEPGGVPSMNNGQPFSIDTIEEFNIGISPYATYKSNFVGGDINAVTKSGTNEFHGSVYYLYRDDSMIGEDEDGNAFPEFEETVLGITAGGPIIEDKLFFFASYEEFENNKTLSGTVLDVSASDLARIEQISSGYGFNPGTVEAPGELTEADKKYLVKLDWNINALHRMSARWNRTDGSELNLVGRGPFDLSYSTHWYTNEFEFDNFAAQLYSDWSPVFSTEINVSRANFHKYPGFDAQLPYVEIAVDGGDVNLGTEIFRHANDLEVDTTTAFFAGDYLLGDHTIRGGMDYKQNDIHNVFVFASLGQYSFDSIDDYAAGNYSFYQYRIGTDPNDPFPAADWAWKNYGLFLQDTWDLSYNVSLMYGLRWDGPATDDRPLYNPVFEDFYGFRNDGTIDGNGVVQPRFGFNWDLGTEDKMQVRGGFGLFMGSTAGVWLSNPFTNPGGNVTTYRDFDGSEGFTADPFNQPMPGGSSTMDVDVVDPDFNQPTVWKANLALDTELPVAGLIASAEAIITRTKYGIHYEHLNLGDPTGMMPDGRYSYWCDPAAPSRGSARCNSNPDFNDVLLLTNTDKGSTANLTLSVEKPMLEDLGWKVAYTAGRSKDVNPGGSSRAISSWNNNAIMNPNEEKEATSNFQIKDRFIASLNYRKFFFEGLATNVGLFYEARSGRPFSWTFSNDANGDGIRDNDLLYVPSGPGDVLFVDEGDEAAFLALVERVDALREAQGTVIGKNTDSSPWVRQMDLKISQEIPVGGFGKGVVFFNVLNVLNLINDDWGHIDQVPFEYVAEVVNFVGVDPDSGRYIYDYQGRDEFTRRQDSVGQSRWGLQLGFRFEF